MGTLLALSAWAAGCDDAGGDGPAEADAAGALDRGTPAEDAFVPVVDGEVPGPDAMSPVLDAEGPIRDRGLPADAGPDAAEQDARTEPDAASPDLGVVHPVACFGELSGLSLREALQGRLSADYRPIEPTVDLGGNLNRYTTARHLMFTRVERAAPPGGGPPGVECVYTGRFVATGPDAEPDDSDVNCEHTWPRARMDADQEGALYEHEQSDIHHLFPADALANSARGSLRFGEVVSDRVLDHMPSILGRDANGEMVFQVRLARRGDVARGLLYFSVRWGADIRDDEEAVLRAWDAADPVDARERARNDAIATVQGNRNPFIDCPGLADRVDDFAAFDRAPEELPLP